MNLNRAVLHAVLRQDFGIEGNFQNQPLVDTSEFLRQMKKPGNLVQLTNCQMSGRLLYDYWVCASIK